MAQNSRDRPVPSFSPPSWSSTQSCPPNYLPSLDSPPTSVRDPLANRDHSPSSPRAIAASPVAAGDRMMQRDAVVERKQGTTMGCTCNCSNCTRTKARIQLASGTKEDNDDSAVAHAIDDVNIMALKEVASAEANSSQVRTFNFAELVDTEATAGCDCTCNYCSDEEQAELGADVVLVAVVDNDVIEENPIDDEGYEGDSEESADEEEQAPPNPATWQESVINAILAAQAVEDAQRQRVPPPPPSFSNTAPDPPLMNYPPAAALGAGVFPHIALVPPMFAPYNPPVACAPPPPFHAFPQQQFGMPAAGHNMQFAGPIPQQGLQQGFLFNAPFPLDADLSQPYHANGQGQLLLCQEAAMCGGVCSHTNVATIFPKQPQWFDPTQFYLIGYQPVPAMQSLQGPMQIGPHYMAVYADQYGNPSMTVPVYL